MLVTLVVCLCVHVFTYCAWALACAKAMRVMHGVACVMGHGAVARPPVLMGASKAWHVLLAMLGVFGLCGNVLAPIRLC
uniref:Secreted protein n=1 Tax=Cucumis melo TaxID=3656 RepID=A0A9I9EGS3_CUCME